MKQTPVYETKKPSKFGTAVALLTILVATLLIAFGTVYYLQAQDTKAKLNEQTNQTEKLTQEIKVIAEQNSKNSQRAANYAYCNAYLLAKYTQSNDPIVIEDLNKCVVTVFPTGEGAPTIPQESFQRTVGNLQGSTNATPQSSTGTSGGSTAPSGSTPSQGTTNPGNTGTTPLKNNPQQSQSGITLEPGKALPILNPVLNIVPDVKIPGILEIR